MGVAADHLLADARGDVGDAEATLLLGDGAVQEDLEQHVAELLLERLVGRAGPVQPPDGLDQLVDLLDRVAGQALVRLLAVPRALVAQAADDAVEADELGPDRLRHVRDVEAGEVVRHDAAVEVLPADRQHLLVGQAEALEDDDLVRARAVDGQLDVREDPRRVARGRPASAPARRRPRWRTRGRRPGGRRPRPGRSPAARRPGRGTTAPARCARRPAGRRAGGARCARARRASRAPRRRPRRPRAAAWTNASVMAW